MIVRHASVGDDPLHGRDLHYVRRGRPGADCILFLHGITESRRYFTRKVAPLRDRFELFIPDLPGFGLSPKPATRYSMDLFLRATRTFIEHHGLDGRPIRIVAHSLGTLIALEYAAAYPGHARRLVLLSLPRHLSRAEAHRIFWEGSASYRRLLREHSIRESFRQLKRTGLGMSLRYARRFPWQVLADSRKFTFLSLTSTLENCLLDYRVDRILPRVPPVPTLLIHGDRDQVAPFEHILPLPDRYAWLHLLPIHGSGHHMLHTHNRQILTAIRSFFALDRVD